MTILGYVPAVTESLVDSTDVRTAVTAAAAALRSVAGQDWRVPAGDLTWTCWETVEHVADDLFSYAGQLAAEQPPADGYVAWGYQKARPDAPALTIYADPSAGTAGLLQVLEASGGMLAACVQVSPPQRRGFHPYGVSDASGFAAMGIVETLVHLHDIAETLKFPWEPDAGVCARVLARLFPDAPTGNDPWPTLLWSTGRIDLPGHPRQNQWRWQG
jgi:hypothetical protein